MTSTVRHSTCESYCAEFCRKFGEDVPQIIWAIMEPIFGPLIRVSINIQAHGRGLLARFRDHRLGSGVFKLHLPRRETGDAVSGAGTQRIGTAISLRCY